MEKEVVVKEYEYDEEGRVTKETITTTWEGGSKHPFNDGWLYGDDEDGYGLI